MPKDIKKYCNPQKMFMSLESQVVISKKMKGLIKGVISKKNKREWKILNKEVHRLLNQAEKEINKPLPPPGLYSKELKYLSKIYISYYDQLNWDGTYYQKQIHDPFVKKVKREMYGTSKEEFDNIFRMLRIHTSKFQTIKRLKYSHFTDEEEVKEKHMCETLQVINSYLVSIYTSQMIKEFDVSIEKGKVIVKRPEYDALEAQMYNHHLMKNALEQILLISVSLQDESLSEEKRNELIILREKIRKDFNFVWMYEARRALQNGENYKNLIEETIEAHKKVMKVLNIYLEVTRPYISSYPDLGMKELSELRELLRRDDLTKEEREYFIQREVVLEDAIDWEENMKKLIEDFPYERNHRYKVR